MFNRFDPFDRDVSDILLSDRKGRCRCGESRSAAMTRHGKCSACFCRELGKSTIEGHHLFGPNVPIVVWTPVNEHRVMDALRAARHPALREPSNDTLLNVAGLVMQFLELAEMHCVGTPKRYWSHKLADILADKGRGAAEALTNLHAELRCRLGDDWQGSPTGEDWEGWPPWSP